MAAVVEQARSNQRRRSRRNEIIGAAIRVFARQGYADASIQEVATEAGVAPTAVYYHFAGKEDLFDVALHRILESITAVVRVARPDSEPGGRESLEDVIFAVWEWLDAHPEECQLLHYHLPGATPRARRLQEQFEEIHLQRGFDYVQGVGSGSRGAVIARRAKATLAVRTLVNLTLLIHPLRSSDGPLRGYPQPLLRQALSDVSDRIVRGA